MVVTRLWEYKYTYILYAHVPKQKLENKKKAFELKMGWPKKKLFCYVKFGSLRKYCCKQA